MNLTASDIARLVGGELCGDPQAAVTGVAPLKEAGDGDVSFVADGKNLKDLPASRAGVVLVKKGPGLNGRTLIFVENPPFAFARILAEVEKEKGGPDPGVHPSAVVAPGARLGAGVSVGANAVIEAGAAIGDRSQIGALSYVGARTAVGKDCRIHPRVTLREDVVLGDRVIVHSGAVVGADGFGYVTVGKTHHKVPQVGGVLIEDDVELGANVAVDRATIGRTRIGRGTKIDNLVQVAHNVQIGEGCIIVSQTGIAGSSRLGNFVTLAGQVGVVGHVSIGDGAIAAAQSGIPNDVPAGAVVFGSPARPIHEERRIQVIIGKLPRIYEELKKIKKILNLGKGEKEQA